MAGFTLKDLAKKYKAINKKKGYRGWYEATKGSKPSQGAIEVKNAGNVLYNNAFFNQAMGSIDSSTNISGVGTADGGIGMVSSAPAGGGAMGESLNKHITLEEIKNIISTTFKIVSHPVKGQSYILPNGEFIELKDNAHNEIDFLLMDYDLIKDPEYYDSFEDLTLVNDFNSVRIGDGKIINHSPYIILPKNKLTSAQYSSLEDWIWSLEDKNIFIGSSNANKDYSLEEYIPEEIINKIKRYYSSGTLYESKIRKFFLSRLNESSDNNFEIVYYVDKNGRNRVEEYLNSLSDKIYYKVKSNIEKLRILGNKAKYPLTENLGDGLFELRTDINNNWPRIFFFFDKNKLIVLTSGYNKKSNKTDPDEIEKAKYLRKEYFGGKIDG